MQNLASQATQPWVSPGAPVTVEYAPEAFERIRFAAIDGLLSLPRVGVGVGGFLMGEHTSGRIRILDFVEIPCAHGNGPSFNLSAEEIAWARDMPALDGALVRVGMFISKTRGPVKLNEKDREFFQAVCQQPWQLAMLVLPSTIEPTKAQFFYRDPAGAMVGGSELALPGPDPNTPKSADAEPITLATTPAFPSTTPPSAALPSVPRPSPVVLSASLIAPAASAPAAMAAPAAPAEKTPPAEKKRPAAKPPAFAVAAPRSLLGGISSRQPWFVWVIAAALLLTALITLWVTRYDWLPRPPLKLDATDRQNRITLKWNSDAVHGYEVGSIAVNDGGNLHTFQLAARQLEAGTMEYERKSDRVTATLHVGETRAFASWAAPTPVPSAPAVSPITVPQPTAPQ